MTARSSWAGTFEHLFTQMDSPRTDCPTKLVDLEPWTLQDLHNQWKKPLNDHLRIQINFYCIHNNRDLETCGKNISNQLEASLFIEKEVAFFLNNLPKL